LTPESVGGFAQDAAAASDRYQPLDHFSWEWLLSVRAAAQNDVCGRIIDE